MQTLSEIRQLLAERGLKPKHRLGQNFLHDKNQLAKLVDAARVKPGDVVLEVGPGTGTLTEELLDRGAHVIACELDEDMASLIEDRLAAKHGQSLTLIRGDCLAKGGGRSVNPAVIEAIGGRPFKLVANLPYQAASPLMSALLIDHPECLGQYVTIQREVADRLLAKPGTKEYGTLGIVIQSMASVEKLATLSPGCFWPPPEVTSAMVAIVPRPVSPPMASDSRREFARFVTNLFTKRRKQIGGILGRQSDITWPAGITPDQRPEALSVAQFLELWKAIGAID